MIETDNKNVVHGIGTHPGRLLPNAGASAGDDDNLAREIGDVLYVKCRLGRESLAEPGRESTHDGVFDETWWC